MTTRGQLPAAASVCVTTKFAFGVHASMIVSPSASNPATVDTATGAALASHPSTDVTDNVPVITGAVVSCTRIVCTTVLPLLHASLTVYVRVITSGQLPAAASVDVTTKFAFAVHASLIVSPSASNPATVVNAAGAALASQPATVVTASEPVITGAVVSCT